MTAPVPEETNAAQDLTEQPPGTHEDDLPDGDDSGGTSDAQEENAETAQDQPSQ